MRRYVVYAVESYVSAPHGHAIGCACSVAGVGPIIRCWRRRVEPLAYFDVRLEATDGE